MNKKPEQLIRQYSSCPTQQKVYETDGREYIVTRHFTGEKDINQVVFEIAVNRANRETGFFNGV
ncbi:MAG: hypothetical protein K2L12_02660 [Clostridia bacterium]|nr:hypothetical protein [Clostridia bacterium]